MRTHRTISAATVMAAALVLSACDGEQTPVSGTDVASEQEARTATSTGTAPDDSASASDDDRTDEPTGTDDASGDDGSGDDGSGDDGSAAADDEGAEDQASAAATSTAEATEADDDTDDDGQDDDSDGVVAGGPAADLTPSALAAIETALGEVDGTAYEVDDREDGYWEVDVLTSDGSVEVTVAPDGTTVDGTAPDEDDALGDAGRDALGQAQVTLAEAIVAAVRASEAQLDSAELEEEDDAWWWKVVVDSADQDDVELRVDPLSGEVVASQG